MQYLLMIYHDENKDEKKSPAELERMMGEYFAFTEQVKARKVHVGSNPLQRISSATTVRVRDGKVLTTDGPFAETKEQLGGYYLIEAESPDEAAMIAAKIPGARFGSIEIRPIQKFS